MTRQDMIDRLGAVKTDLDMLGKVLVSSNTIDLTSVTLHEVYQALVRIAFQNEIVREALIHER